MFIRDLLWNKHMCTYVYSFRIQSLKMHQMKSPKSHRSPNSSTLKNYGLPKRLSKTYSSCHAKKFKDTAIRKKTHTHKNN